MKPVWIGAAVPTTTLVGCSSSGTEPGQTVTVFAAASLKKTFAGFAKP